MVLSFFARVLLVRSISLADWSAFSFGLSLVSVLAAVGTLGLPSAVARSLPYAESDADRRSILRTTVLLGTSSAVVASVLLFLFAGPIGRMVGSSEVTLALQVFPIAVGCSVVETLLASVFQGFEDVLPNALYLQVLNPALFLAFLVALAIAPSGLTFEGALVAYVGANVASLVAITVHSVRRIPRSLRVGPGATPARRRLLRLAAPLFLVGVMGSILGTGDTIVLGAYHNAEVGTYTATLTLARLLQVGVGASGYIFLPVAAKFLRRSDTESVRLTYGTVTKWMLLLSLPLALLFLFVPSASLGLVYGSEYSSVVVPLQLTTVAAFATAVLGPAAPAQVAFGDAHLQAFNAVAGAVVDVVVALVLVPPYGYVGAAVAWGSANLTWTILCLLELALIRGVHPFERSFVRPLIATAVPAGALLFLARSVVRLWMLPPIALAVAGMFLVLVLLTGSVDRGDRLLLEAVEGWLGRPLPWLRRLGRIGRRD